MLDKHINPESVDCSVSFRLYISAIMYGSTLSPTCLLCEDVLPPGQEDALDAHLSRHHKVTSNLSFVKAASNLITEQIIQILKLIESFGECNDLPPHNVFGQALDFQINEEKLTEPECLEEKVKIEFSEQEVKKENEEVELKHIKKKRGTKKGSSILGCMDKKTLPETLELGLCSCPLCKKQFNVTDMETEKQYRRHLYVHRVKKFECQCENTWQTDKGLKFHIYKYHRGNFHCETCRMTFQTLDLYEEHLAADPHKKENFICDDCGFTSPNKPTFYAHIKYHHDKDIQACKLCNKEFEGTFRLKLHMRSFHAEKKPCPLCGEMIKKMGIHMKTMHTKDSEKKYQCEMCGKGFAAVDKYQSHKMSVHIKARPFVCRYGCGAATNDKGNRKKHEITKHGKSFDELGQDVLEPSWIENPYM